jgi:DNA-binding NtrC family response regulator
MLTFDSSIGSWQLVECALIHIPQADYESRSQTSASKKSSDKFFFKISDHRNKIWELVITILQLLENFEREYLTQLLKRCDGNLSRGARESGLHRKSMERLVKKYQLDARAMKPK